jgi:hypothetical protein
MKLSKLEPTRYSLKIMNLVEFSALRRPYWQGCILILPDWPPAKLMDDNMLCAANWPGEGGEREE